MKQAENTFFSEAYHKREHERSYWMRDVANEFLLHKTEDGLVINSRKLGGPETIKVLEKIAQITENHSLTMSNDIFSEVILKAFLETEKNEEVKQLVSNAWVGLWDSPNFINACVNKELFYDQSYLVRYTSEFQIILRKVVELFCTIVFLLNTLPSEKKLLDTFSKMLAIELHDIKYENDEIGVEDIVSQLPEKIRSTYNEIFEKTFLAGCTFIIFHEIGHKIEQDARLSRLYDVTPSAHTKDTSQKQHASEFNADTVSFKIVDTLFGRDESTDWLGYSGILLCFLTLSTAIPNTNQTTDHPSLQSRCFAAKNFIISKLGSNAEQYVFQRVDIVEEMLSKIFT